MFIVPRYPIGDSSEKEDSEQSDASISPCYNETDSQKFKDNERALNQVDSERQQNNRCQQE